MEDYFKILANFQWCACFSLTSFHPYSQNYIKQSCWRCALTIFLQFLSYLNASFQNTCTIFLLIQHRIEVFLFFSYHQLKSLLFNWDLFLVQLPTCCVFFHRVKVWTWLSNHLLSNLEMCAIYIPISLSDELIDDIHKLSVPFIFVL